MMMMMMMIVLPQNFTLIQKKRPLSLYGLYWFNLEWMLSLHFENPNLRSHKIHTEEIDRTDRTDKLVAVLPDGAEPGPYIHFWVGTNYWIWKVRMSHFEESESFLALGWVILCCVLVRWFLKIETREESDWPAAALVDKRDIFGVSHSGLKWLIVKDVTHAVQCCAIVSLVVWFPEIKKRGCACCACCAVLCIINHFFQTKIEWDHYMTQSCFDMTHSI